jgi:signal transduction histidine kinase
MSTSSRITVAAGVAWRGLAGTLFAADPAPGWRSPWRRRAAHVALAATTLAAALASLATLVGMPFAGLRAFLTGGARINVSAVIERGARPVQFVPAAAHTSWRGVQTVVGPGSVLPGNGPLGKTAAPDLVQLLARPAESTVVAVLAALAVLVALAVVVPLPLAVRYPLLGWRIGWLALLLVPLAGVSWWPGWPWGPVQILALLVVFCVAGVRHPRPVLWWMWALSLIPWWLRADSGRPGVLAAAVGTVAFTAVAVAVDAVGARRRAQQALAGQAELAELEQARRAVLEERAKIARELHDVVAHHMSLIAVRAETAPYRLDGLPEEVRSEFGSLSEAAREALADMRRLLGVLRHDQPAARAPQPQLSDLPTLIQTARQAGVSVALSVPPALGQVPSGVGVCAYRIVQESLSNASRHAPGAPVMVSLDHAASAVLLQVANGPAAPAAPAIPATANGHGQGIAGMRERVALLGGALTAGPSPDGGFIVSAVLPLSEAA